MGEALELSHGVCGRLIVSLSGIQVVEIGRVVSRSREIKKMWQHSYTRKEAGEGSLYTSDAGRQPPMMTSKQRHCPSRMQVVCILTCADRAWDGGVRERQAMVRRSPRQSLSHQPTLQLEEEP